MPHVSTLFSFANLVTIRLIIIIATCLLTSCQSSDFATNNLVGSSLIANNTEENNTEENNSVNQQYYLVSKDSINNKIYHKINNTQQKSNIHPLVAYNQLQWKRHHESLNKPKKSVKSTTKIHLTTIKNNHNQNNNCLARNAQSPINIVKTVVPLAEVGNHNNINLNYPKQEFMVEETLSGVNYYPKNIQQNYISINNKNYYLQALQYHISSEHTVMNVHLPIEIQLIHQAEDGERLNLSVFVNFGDKNPKIQQFIDAIPPTNKTIVNVSTAQLELQSLIPTNGFYSYSGSYTSKPYTEKVQWLLATKAITASSRQFHQLKSHYFDNPRAIQPQGNRNVYLIR